MGRRTLEKNAVNSKKNLMTDPQQEARFIQPNLI